VQSPPKLSEMPFSNITGPKMGIFEWGKKSTGTTQLGASTYGVIFEHTCLLYFQKWNYKVWYAF
jgi:hypothetical protein